MGDQHSSRKTSTVFRTPTTPSTPPTAQANRDHARPPHRRDRAVEPDRQSGTESSDSTASDHPIHDENKGPVKATADDHKSKGPAIPEKVPDATGTKDELKAKAQEMNK